LLDESRAAICLLRTVNEWPMLKVSIQRGEKWLGELGRLDS
jgi:hypothetical protein